MSRYVKNLCRRLSFRLPEEMAVWVEGEARKLGVGPCEFVRALIGGQMRAERLLASDIAPFCRKGEEMSECPATKAC